MLCAFQTTPTPNELRCQRCGFTGEFVYPPQQVRRQCDVIDLNTWETTKRATAPICRHLGPELGLKECQGCRGRVRVKEFACLHPRHAKTQLSACATCTDFAPHFQIGPKPQTLLIRFPHGFGDAVQLTIVLRHLRAEFPHWEISVAAKPGMESLFTGLVNKVLPLDISADGFDVARTLAWHEPDECYVDSPATKAERCLREVFNLRPRPDRSRYHVRPDDRDKCEADKFALAVRERFPHHRGFVLVHYQGNSARRLKNVGEDVIRSACQRICRLRFVPVVLDWDRRNTLWKQTGLSDHVVCPDARHPLWRNRGIGDAGAIAALAERATLCLGIDSGPGHIFAAGATPTIIVWTWHHPLHFFPAAENVTHLVPHYHERLLRGSTPHLGRDYFFKHYNFRTYRRLPSALGRLIEEAIGRGSPSELEQGSLEMFRDLWIRAGSARDAAEVSRDYFHAVNNKSVCRRRPRAVLDLAPGTGAFVCAMRERSRRTRICCWNDRPQLNGVLQANVAEFAEVLPYSADDEQVLAGMLDWLRTNQRPLDLLRYDARCSRSTGFAKRIAQHHRRPNAN